LRLSFNSRLCLSAAVIENDLFGAVLLQELLLEFFGCSSNNLEEDVLWLVLEEDRECLTSP
jgi:hypothetical protein